jgi:putative endonuclease
MAYTYIIYSVHLDKYYVGSTSEGLDSRLRKHLSSHKGYTSHANDWVLVYSEEYSTKKDAVQRELEIKSWKSRMMIEKLIPKG